MPAGILARNFLAVTIVAAWHKGTWIRGLDARIVALRNFERAEVKCAANLDMVLRHFPRESVEIPRMHLGVKRAFRFLLDVFGAGAHLKFAGRTASRARLRRAFGLHGSPAGWLSVTSPPLCPSNLQRDFQRLEIIGIELFQQMELPASCNS